MHKKNIMIALPPSLKGPAMVKSPPLDIGNLVAILKMNANNNVILADFRKHIVKDSTYYEDKGIDLSIFNDFKRCLRHFLSEDVEISRNVNQILAGTRFAGVEYLAISVSVLCQFSLSFLMSALCLAKQAKRECPEIKIILFGNCPDGHVEKVIRIFKCIDAFATGGNEFYVADYIEGRREGMTDGVYYRENGKVSSPQKVKNVNLDKFPLADYSLLDLDSYKSNGRLVLPYELSRGCSQRCFYCYYIYKGMINLKDPAKAVTEFIALSRRYDTDRFHIADGAVNLDPDWLIQLCDLLAQQPHKVKWCALAIPHMSSLMLDKLKQAGCVQLRWGVESGSERMLKKINKGTTRETIRHALTYAHSIGINNYITLISGLPGELDSDIEDTKAFMQEMAPYIDSVQECLYGELGHFPMAVFEPSAKKVKIKKQVAKYKDVLDRLNLERIDIIDFMEKVEN